MVPLSDLVFLKVYIETKKNLQRTWPDYIEIFFYGFYNIPNIFTPTRFFENREILMESIYHKPFEILFVCLWQSCRSKVEQKKSHMNRPKKNCIYCIKIAKILRKMLFFIIFTRNGWTTGSLRNLSSTKLVLTTI